jgi:hypothetical protein
MIEHCILADHDLGDFRPQSHASVAEARHSSGIVLGEFTGRRSWFVHELWGRFLACSSCASAG